MSGSSTARRKTIAMTIGWWYIRRLIRKRGAKAVAGFVAGEGLSLARRPHKRRPLRWLLFLLAGALAAGGAFLWRRRQGGGDDWGQWDPTVPVGPEAPKPAEPGPDLEAKPNAEGTSVSEPVAT